MREFELIEQIKKRFSVPFHPDFLTCGIGDDAALIRPTSSLAIATDVLISGVHFKPDDAAFDIGFKSLAVNLSDLAAMGATPLSVLLTLTLPTGDETWCHGFLDGFQTLAQAAQVDLIGGDTSQGPLAIGITALGALDSKHAFKRDGAQSGDLLCVSGTLGLAAWAFQDPLSAPLVAHQKLHRPGPQLKLAAKLSGTCRCAIDISDGLFADLNHILKASNKGAMLNWDQLPLPTGCALPTQDLIGFGDDYELLFTLPPEQVTPEFWSALQAIVPVTVIGHITAKSGIELQNLDPSIHASFSRPSGWEHFS